MKKALLLSLFMSIHAYASVMSSEDVKAGNNPFTAEMIDAAEARKKDDSDEAISENEDLQKIDERLSGVTGDREVFSEKENTTTSLAELLMLLENDVGNAQSTANTANSKATTAQSTANSAYSKATTAQSTANTANSKASSGGTIQERRCTRTTGQNDRCIEWGWRNSGLRIVK